MYLFVSMMVSRSDCVYAPARPEKACQIVFAATPKKAHDATNIR